MTLIALPAGVAASQFSLRQITTQRASSSNFGGSTQVVDLLNDRWAAAFTYPNLSNATAARVEAFIGAMRGMTNTVALWHFRRPVPRGTMRAPTGCQVTPAGSDQVMVYCPPGQTLLAGDLIGIQGLLLQLREDAVSDGSGHLIAKLINRTRKFIPEGSTVTWDRPTAAFRLISQVGVQYVPGYAPEVALDFVESVP